MSDVGRVGRACEDERRAAMEDAEPHGIFTDRSRRAGLSGTQGALRGHDVLPVAGADSDEDDPFDLGAWPAGRVKVTGHVEESVTGDLRNGADVAGCAAGSTGVDDQAPSDDPGRDERAAGEDVDSSERGTEQPGGSGDAQEGVLVVAEDQLLAGVPDVFRHASRRYAPVVCGHRRGPRSMRGALLRAPPVSVGSPTLRAWRSAAAAARYSTACSVPVISFGLPSGAAPAMW